MFILLSLLILKRKIFCQNLSIGFNKSLTVGFVLFLHLFSHFVEIVIKKTGQMTETNNVFLFSGQISHFIEIGFKVIMLVTFSILKKFPFTFENKLNTQMSQNIMNTFIISW